MSSDVRAAVWGAVLGFALVAPINQSALACEPFVAYGAGDSRSVAYIDVGEAGLSQGDMRLGGRRLVDDEGQPIGAYSWVLTLQEPPDEDGRGAVSINAYLELADGQVMLQTLARNTGQLDDVDAVVVRPPIEFAIVGGTGVYAGAEGTTRLILAGADAVFVTDIYCD